MERKYLEYILSRPSFRRIERTFYLEFRARLPREDTSIPECIGDYEYYMAQQPYENFPVYLRRHLKTKQIQTILNQNSESMFHQVDVGKNSFLSMMKINPQNQNLILCIFENEHEETQLILKDISSGKILLSGLKTSPDHQVRSVEWASSTCFYYTRLDPIKRRPYQVYSYDFVSHQQVQLFHEQDEAFFVDLSHTKDGRFVLINCNSKTSSEIHAIDTFSSLVVPFCLRPREKNTLYFADHAKDQFYIVTNADNAINYKIMTMKISSSSSMCASPKAWKTWISDSKDIKIEDIDLFKDFLVIYQRVKSIPRIWIKPLVETKKAHFVSLPSPHAICRVIPGVNRTFESHHVRFTISTPFVPEIVYDYDMLQQKLSILKQTPAIPSTTYNNKRIRKNRLFDPQDFECTRVFASSENAENVQVPLTLIHRKDLARNGTNPTLLLGYGAYGTNMETDFQLEHLSLLERGWIIALAHVRGGGELGLDWYQQGKGLKKKNTFVDFLTCTNYLIQHKYTSPQYLAAKGTSAGGLIMGYMANEYPDLFRALILKVPFMDIAQTMMDETLPLTIHEYDEWGNPSQDKQIHEYIQSYSPCENIRPFNTKAPQQYPAMWITASMNDYRVPYWEPVKWVYQIRHRPIITAAIDEKNQKKKPTNNLLVLKMSETDGHFGSGGKLEQLQESAMEIAFLYQALGLKI
jgi:oligopeptidase B